MKFQRLIELCHVLKECDELPAGAFKVWARANALRQIRELLEELVPHEVSH